MQAPTDQPLHEVVAPDLESKELAMPIDFCSKDELLKFMSDEEALKKSLKEADEGKLISFEEVKRKFRKRNRRANRKVARETTATRLWQIFVRRVKNG